MGWDLHHGRYILVERVPVPEPDLFTWGVWMEQRDRRRVAESNVGPLRVSTVFMGLDHNFDDDGPPLLFETMIFDGGEDSYQERCSTWDEAEKMHAEAVRIAEERLTAAEPLLATPPKED